MKDPVNLISSETIRDTGAATKTLSPSKTSNHLGSTTYDASGNQLHWGTLAYEWDDFNNLKTLQGQGNHRTYLYTADDERVWTSSFTSADSPDTWTFTLRGLDNKVLTTYEAAGNGPGSWEWKKDYVYRGGLLLAAETADGTRTHFTLDHLGTPRVLTGALGQYVSDHHYFGFGEEITPSSTSETMKFTGHERDFNSGSGTGDDLDYMHARYCNPNLGRFLSVDPKVRLRPIKLTQLWGRYSYAAGNPIKFVDPDGEDLKLAFDFSNSNLSSQQQLQVSAGTRRRFRNAGVKNVQIFTKGSPIKPKTSKGTDKVVRIKVTAEPIAPGTFGMNRPPSNTVIISTSEAPSSDKEKVNFLVNVVSHEVDHGSRALPKFDNDARPLGSILNPEPAEAGSVMEQGVSAEALGQGLREFSDEDAENLRQALNEPEPQ